jgi:hypothetical protein
MLLREHRFKFIAGTTHIFTIEEIVKGMAVWPHKFRLRLPASSNSEAKTFYGATCYEVAEKAAESMAGNLGQPGMHRPTLQQQGPPDSPPQDLQVQAAD